MPKRFFQNQTVRSTLNDTHLSSRQEGYHCRSASRRYCVIGSTLNAELWGEIGKIGRYWRDVRIPSGYSCSIDARAETKIAVPLQALGVWKIRQQRCILASKPLAVVPASSNELETTENKAEAHPNLYRIGRVGLRHTPEIHLMVRLELVGYGEAVGANPPEEG